ncbi:MAG: tRNA epoxyqueuosine(34) reductase QueG [Thermomicrobiaceae bacterium]
MRVITRALDRSRVAELASEAGLSVTGVGPAGTFGDELGDLLVDRIRGGHLDGLHWFTEERARFSVDPRNLHAGARSIISVGVPYWNPDIRHPNDGVLRGRVSRYAWGRDYHKTLKQRMQHFHRLLEDATGRSIEARHLVDTARVVDRAIAARSGLGWYGKNTMILVPRRGSWVMLGELVVDLDLEHDIPLKPKCGQCTRCLDVCPTGALVDEYVLHTPSCISFLTIELRGSIPREIRTKMGEWVFGCDMCQEICPYTNAAYTEDEPTFHPKSVDHAYPPLHWLINMDEVEFRAEFSGTAVMRARWDGMVRNAAVAIGNIGSESDLDLLERIAREHSLPTVRGHASWAMARIDRDLAQPALRSLRSQEHDHEVVEEIDSALAIESV